MERIVLAYASINKLKELKKDIVKELLETMYHNELKIIELNKELDEIHNEFYKRGLCVAVPPNQPEPFRWEITLPHKSKTKLIYNFFSNFHVSIRKKKLNSIKS